MNTAPSPVPAPGSATPDSPGSSAPPFPGAHGPGALAGLLDPGADEVFAALADRTRRQILVRLVEKPDDAGAVARDLGLSRQAVAKQLRILETAGMVDVARQSARKVHSVDPSRIREVSDLLGIVAQGWEQRLAGIKDLAEALDVAPSDAAPLPASAPGASEPEGLPPGGASRPTASTPEP